MIMLCPIFTDADAFDGGKCRSPLGSHEARNYEDILKHGEIVNEVSEWTAVRLL